MNTHYEVQLESPQGEIVKIEVDQDKLTDLPEITNVGIIELNFVPQEPVMIKQTIDVVTAVK